MNAITRIDFHEITRLTRAGRVHEATALIRGGLAGPLPATTSAPPRDAAAVDFSCASDGAWHLPDTSAFPAREPMPTSPAPTDQSSGRARSTMRPREGASFVTRDIRNAAGALSYKLYVPSRLPAGRVPLVVMLHGCTQDPDDFAAGTRMNDHAETYGFLVAYPAQSHTANASRCWNWFRSGDQHRGSGEPSLVAEVASRILAEHPVASDRIYIAGLSAGGAAAAVLGCAYPDLFAGVGVHSGLACGAASDMPSAFAAMRGGGSPSGARRSSSVPTIVFHGAADRTVNPTNAKRVLDQVASRGDSGSTRRGTTVHGVGYETTTWLDIGGRKLAEQWTVDGGGHAWFGGSTAGSYTDPRGPDASLEMLRFFSIAPPVG